MPGSGVGGMLANLFNPGLDQQVAASITPNPSPLAQQDQQKVPPVPGAPSNPAPGQAPPQVTQPDPTLAQTNQLLMRAYQVQQAADSFNHGLQGMAASVGTAQQQASKMAALGGAQGGGGQGYLDMVAKMQGIDQQQTAQTEHAQFLANVGVLANSLFPNDPDAVAKAQEVARNPEMLQQMGQVMATGMTPTDMMRNTDAAARAYADANPNASGRDIAQFKSNLLSYGAMGGDSKAREYMQAKQAWLNDPSNKGQSLPPELQTQAAFEQNQAAGISTAVGKANDLRADKANFQPALQAYDQKIGILNQLNQPNMKAGMQEFLGTIGSNRPVATMSADGKAAYALYTQLMAGQFAAGVQDFKGAGRITQQELNQDAPSQSTMGKLNQDPSSFFKGMDAYQQQLTTHRANLFGKAQYIDDPRLSDEDYASALSSNYKPGGDLGPKTTSRNDFSRMSDNDAEAAYARLPSKAKFIGPDNQVHVKP